MELLLLSLLEICFLFSFAWQPLEKGGLKFEIAVCVFFFHFFEGGGQVTEKAVLGFEGCCVFFLPFFLWQPLEKGVLKKEIAVCCFFHFLVATPVKGSCCF